MEELSRWYVVIGAFAVGAVLGSFANVVIFRQPRSRSLVSPGSSCPECGAPIAWYDNIPLISYLVLGGRCRRCGAPISPRYPAVEFVTAAWWALVGWKFGITAVLPAFLVFATTLVILSFIDLEHRRLPNIILGPAAIAGVLLLGIAAAVQGDWISLRDAFLGAIVYGAPLLVIGLLFPAGMGGGDIKLAAYLGLHLGWLSLLHVVVGMIIGFMAAGLTGIVLMASGRKGRKDVIPFGPFMALGALISVAAGSWLLHLWLGT
jgi:leader peptidase (prepilin peptidase) / N-methyltransferase